MEILNVPFQTIDWSQVAPTTHPGDRGEAKWWTVERGNLRIRLVEYSAGYIANHWCERGHLVHVLEGSFVSELRDGRSFTLGPGQAYVVSSGDGAHRSRSDAGVRLLIVD
jgi:hypothetical protein